MTPRILRAIEASVLENLYLAHGNVVQQAVSEFQVTFGGESRERLEVVDEVGLIVEAAILRNVGPIHLSRFFDFRDCFLKANDFQVSLGRYAHLPLEHADEMLL